MKFQSLCLLVLLIAFSACKETADGAEVFKNNIPSKYKDSLNVEKEKKQIVEKPIFHYHFEYKKIWSKIDSFEGYAHQRLLAAINRVDEKHLKHLDSFLVPNQYDDSLAHYLPFPIQSAVLSDINKIIIFSYPTQSFAAYEKGHLILTGPTNMGKKASKTPLGLFFCNWKSKETRSTVDNDWILKWNFNVSNIGGVGFHQYDLPGYPASHSCMRLWAQQAEFLYYWAEQWTFNAEHQLVAKGTPVIVYGEYPFGKPRPWFVLAQDGKAIDISEENLIEIVQVHKASILAEQQKLDDLISQKAPISAALSR